jgi:hypothetical protein
MWEVIISTLLIMSTNKQYCNYSVQSKALLTEPGKTNQGLLE